jgi:hypothetical protein
MSRPRFLADNDLKGESLVQDHSSELEPALRRNVGITGRLPRATDHGLVYHAMNCGNNRADVFAADGDHEFSSSHSASRRAAISRHGEYAVGLVDTLLDGFPEWEQLGQSGAERRPRWRTKLRSGAEAGRTDNRTRLAADRTTAGFSRLARGCHGPLGLQPDPAPAGPASEGRPSRPLGPSWVPSESV